MKIILMGLLIVSAMAVESFPERQPPVMIPQVTSSATAPSQPPAPIQDDESLEVDEVATDPVGEEPEIPVVPVTAEGIDQRTGQPVQTQVWGVPIGRYRIATVSHLVEGITVRTIRVNGRAARLHRHQNHTIDFANALCDTPFLITAPYRTPRYFERVRVRAMRTGRTMRGIVSLTSPLWTVSLDQDQAGIQQGDSGSPILSESGELLGVVSGYHGATTLGTANPLTVRFEPILALQIPGLQGPGQSPEVVRLDPPASPNDIAAMQGLSNCPQGTCQTPYRYQVRQRVRWRR